MKKSIIIIACILTLSIGALLLSNCAVAEEGRTQKISWVAEKWSYDYERREKIEKVSNIIYTYDIATTKISEVQIPLEWIPLKTIEPQKGILFAIENERNGERLIDVFCWNDGDTIMLDCDIRIMQQDNLLTYVNGKLYTSHPTTMVEFGELENGEEEPLQVYDERNLRYYDLNSWPGFTVMNNKLLYDDMIRKGINYGGLVSVSKNIGEHQYFETPPGRGLSFAPYKDEHILIWKWLSNREIPAVSLYWYEEGGGMQEYRHELYNVFHLAEYNLLNGEYAQYTNFDDEAIELVDLEPIESYMAYISDLDSIVLLCQDNSPLDQLQYMEGGPEARKILMMISLKTGERTDLYVNGNSKPDYETMWKYAIKARGVLNSDGTYWADISEEDMKRLKDAERTYPIKEEDVANGIKEFWPENFAISIS